MDWFCRGLTVVAASLVCSVCFADGAPASALPASAPTPSSSAWSGDVSAGYVRTNGNTNSSTLNFKGDLGWKRGRWTNALNGQAAMARSDGNSTAESYQASDKLSYNFTDKDYVFARANYLSDRFAGIVETYSLAAGYGRQIFKTDAQKLDLDIGVGVNRQRVSGSHHFDSELVGVFDGDYTWKISDNAQFEQKLHIETGHLNTFINPITDLKLTIVGNLYASLDYEVRYNTKVPAGTVHMDTITAINIGYSFGKK